VPPRKVPPSLRGRVALTFTALVLAACVLAAGLLVSRAQATRQIRARVPGTEVLIFTMHDTASLLREMLEAGAKVPALGVSALASRGLRAGGTGRRHDHWLCQRGLYTLIGPPGQTIIGNPRGVRENPDGTSGSAGSGRLQPGAASPSAGIVTVPRIGRPDRSCPSSREQCATGRDKLGSASIDFRVDPDRPRLRRGRHYGPVRTGAYRVGDRAFVRRETDRVRIRPIGPGRDN
jgi:hypothetical protein